MARDSVTVRGRETSRESVTIRAGTKPVGEYGRAEPLFTTTFKVMGLYGIEKYSRRASMRAVQPVEKISGLILVDYWT